MKDKILVFIIGLLVGAVITASAFLIYEKVNNNTTNTMEFKDGMQMMERPDNMDFSNISNGNRPEPPSKNNSTPNNSSNL